MRIPLGVTATDFTRAKVRCLLRFDYRSRASELRVSRNVSAVEFVAAGWWMHAVVSCADGPGCAKWRGARAGVQLKGQWSKTSAPRHYFDVIGQSFAIAQEMMSSVWRNAAT